MSVCTRLLWLLCRARNDGVIINDHALSARATQAQVEILGRFFDLIHHDDLLKRLETPGKRPFCLLTFDDGKRANAVETAKTLTRLGVPGVFYLSTEFISNGHRPLWFDRRTAICRHLGCVPPGLDSELLKQLPGALRDDRLDRASQQYGVDADMTDDRVRPMTWDDARDLHKHGHTIGAHSCWHSILTRESREDAKQDIERSIAEVTQQIGKPCTTFGFPNGNYTAELAEHAIQCGVQTVMNTHPTWVRTDTPFWRLPRVQLDEQQSPNRIVCKLIAAASGFLLEGPDGTGRLYWSINRRARRLRAPGRR